MPSGPDFEVGPAFFTRRSIGNKTRANHATALRLADLTSSYAGTFDSMNELKFTVAKK